MTSLPKFNLINISVCKNKYFKSQCELRKIKNWTRYSNQWYKKWFPVNTVEEELVLQDDVCLEGETNSEFPKSLRSNFKAISNK